MRKPVDKNLPETPREQLLICLILVVVTVAVFWRVATFEFTDLDDGAYIKDNTYVAAGLTPETVKWAFTTTWVSTWQPMTWLSYMLDREIADSGILQSLSVAGVFHVSNLLLHLACVLLLYGILSRITGIRWRSAFVALLFSIHPLHVESVAWVTERKDVLSTLFVFLAIWAYVRYTVARTLWWYLLVAATFVLGLMSKPTVQTLPIALLLLDYWPLARLRTGGAEQTDGRSWGRLVLEKAPLLIIAAASSAAILLIMRSQENLATSGQTTAWQGIINATVNYAHYIWKMLWPTDLSVLYPQAGTAYPAWGIALSAASIVSISVVMARFSRRRPYLAFGWLWYVVTLLPVSGIVQQGILMRGDHFSYVPLIGLLVIVAWGVPDVLAALFRGKTAECTLRIAATAVVLVMAVVSSIQVTHWRNSVTLFSHALNVTKDNYLANVLLGFAVDQEGDPAGARRMYREALRINPRSEDAHFYLGTSLAARGRHGEALVHLQRAVELRPDYINARNNLGALLIEMKRYSAAIEQYNEVLKIEPWNQMARRGIETARAGISGAL